MQVHEAITDILRAEGIDTVFALLSEEIIPMLAHVDEADGPSIRIVDTRHEQGAAGMADGYARTSDDVGVCLVGRGPAIAQTGTSLVTARKRGAPVLYIVPETALGETYDDKGFDQETYLRTMVGDVRAVRSTETLVPTVREAFRTLRTGGGPVAIQVPEDLLATAIEDPLAYPDTPAGHREQTATLQPDEATIADAVELYLDSDATKPPVVLAGRGAVAADARPALERLAERINAVLATTMQARGYVAGHPFGVGLVGDLGTPIANEHLTASDFVVAVGCSLNPHTTDAGRLIADGAKVVHVDTEPRQIGRFAAVDLAIYGDAAATTAALTDALAAADIDRTGEFWTDDARRRIAASDPLDGREVTAVEGRMDPREVVGRLDDILPRDRVVVTDAGHFTAWVVDGISTPTPTDFVWTLDFVAVGQGLPVAIGASLARPNQATVAFCGDAGVMMSLQEIETAARNDVDVLVVVLNDATLGAEYHQAQAAGYGGEVAAIEPPDIAAVAADLGAEAYSVASLDELAAIEERIGTPPSGPVVLECRVNREVRHRIFGG